MPYSKVTLTNANLESIFSCTNQPVYIVGPDLKVIYANSHTIKLVGKTKLNTLHCYDIFHVDGKQPDNCPWKKPACGVTSEKKCVCKKGYTENFCSIDAVPILDPGGKVMAALHMVEVTTEQVRLAEELVHTNEELQLMNEISSVLSRSLELEEVLGAALERLTQWSDFKAGSIFLAKDDFIEMQVAKGLSQAFIKSMKKMSLGQGLSGLAAKRKRIVISEDAQTDERTKKTVLAREGLRASIAVPLIMKGKLQGVLTLGTPNTRKFSSGEINFLESIADQMAVVMENAKLYQKTIVLSRTDSLTGLFNSRYFEEILQRQLSWAKRKGQSFALMMLDIDNLKSINDLYGHDSGDMMLRKFSQLLRENLRESDFFARYGGDEFVVLLADCGKKTAKTVATKLKRKVATTRMFGFDKKPLMTTSIGLAMFPESASTMISLIKAADIAMYRAKQDGKNKICLFEPSLLPDIHFDTKRLERFAHNADLNAIQTLVTAVDLKDRYTGGHSSEVSRLAVFLAQKIGLSEQDLEDIRLAALLHDIGKIGISDNILLKPHKLTEREFAQVRKHPEMGVSILRYSKDFNRLLPIVLHHHERWDGEGYPHKLQGDKIPLLARIIAVADAFEAMTSNRPYRRGMTKKKALTQLWKFSETQFDPQLVQAFTNVVKDLDQSDLSALFLKSTT